MMFFMLTSSVKSWVVEQQAILRCNIKYLWEGNTHTPKKEKKPVDKGGDINVQKQNHRNMARINTRSNRTT